MERIKQICIVLLVCTVAILFPGCSKSETPAGKSETQAASQGQKTAAGTARENAVSLTISAAASLKDSMEEIEKLYAAEKPEVAITYNFGGSGSLQQQIEQGAPVDIFISAAATQTDSLKQKGLLAEDTLKNLLTNKVVLVVPKDSGLVKDFNGLTGDGVKKVALGEPKSVPAGKYGEDVLSFMKIKDKIQPKAVYAKDVKEVLTWVETGNADAGIVYETDAKLSAKVKIAAYAPENSHKPVIYPAAVIKGSRNADAAKAFLAFLSGDKAKSVFEKYGFGIAK